MIFIVDIFILYETLLTGSQKNKFVKVIIVCFKSARDITQLNVSKFY